MRKNNRIYYYGILIVQVMCIFTVSAALFLNTGFLRQETYNRAIEENEIKIYIYKDWDYILESQISDDRDERLQAIMLNAFARTYHEEWLKTLLSETSADIIGLIGGNRETLENITDFSLKKEVYVNNLTGILKGESQENLDIWLSYPDDIKRSAEFLAESRVKIPDELNLGELAGENNIAAFRDVSRSVISAVSTAAFAGGIIFVLSVALSFFISGYCAAFKSAGKGIIAGVTFFFLLFLSSLLILRNIISGILVLELEFLMPVVDSVLKGYMFSGLLIWIPGVILGAGLFCLSFYSRFKFPGKAIISSAIALAFLSSCSGTGNNIQENNLNQDNGYIEISGTSVIPHVVSGEIPSFNRKDPFVFSETKGSLIRIFVKNIHDEIPFRGRVLFNGMTGKTLLDKDIVSWCSVPDVRPGAGLSSNIPPGATDSYILNVTDSSFYENGITVTMEYAEYDLVLNIHTDISYPEVFAERLIFGSSEKTRVSDRMTAFFRNESEEDITVKGLEILTAAEYYSVHWWKEKVPAVPSVETEGVTISTGEMNVVEFSYENLPHGDSIFIFEVYSETGTNYIFYQMKPLVLDFDINLGWAGRHLAASRYFAKTASLMHFNTVHGDMHGYMGSKTWEEYPFKGFAAFENTSFFNQPENIIHIHGVEFLGEPQMSNADPQEIYNRFSVYRLSGYPTTLTLTHEPGYFIYSGLSDFPHFDAYRVIAPHADKWGEYKNYGEKNTLWGAPLETAGTYVRTLHEISRPQPVAAWTQGVAGGWFSPWRITSPNPNNTEIRLQAYQKVANGALSLYWFNISGTNVVRNRYALNEIRNINREMMTAERFIMNSIPYSWENEFMDMDKNVLAGKDFAILFVMDLDYRVSPVNEFIIDSARRETLEYHIPSYLSDCDSVVRISAEGISEIDAVFEEGKVTFSDSFHTAGMYLLFRRESGYREVLEEKHLELLEREKSTGFDPIGNDDDFLRLKEQINP